MNCFFSSDYVRTETIPSLIHVPPAELVPKQVKYKHIECESEIRLGSLHYILTKEMNENTMRMNKLLFEWSNSNIYKFADDNINSICNNMKTLLKICESAMKKAKVVGIVSLLQEDMSLDQRAYHLMLFDMEIVISWFVQVLLLEVLMYQIRLML